MKKKILAAILAASTCLSPIASPCYAVNPVNSTELSTFQNSSEKCASLSAIASPWCAVNSTESSTFQNSSEKCASLYLINSSSHAGTHVNNTESPALQNSLSLKEYLLLALVFAFPSIAVIIGIILRKCLADPSATEIIKFLHSVEKRFVFSNCPNGMSIVIDDIQSGCNTVNKGAVSDYTYETFSDFFDALILFIFGNKQKCKHFTRDDFLKLKETFLNTYRQFFANNSPIFPQ